MMSSSEGEVGMAFSPNKRFIASDEVAGLDKETKLSVDSIRYKARGSDEEDDSVQLTMAKQQGRSS